MNSNNSLVPGRSVTNGEVRGTLLMVAHDRARVLVDDVPDWYPVDSLKTTRGRPALVHYSGLCRWDLQNLVDSSNEFCQEAIRFLFGRQTPIEQQVSHTIYENDMGFRADHARKGTLLALLAPDAWGAPEYSMARGILKRYCGTQLFDLAAERMEGADA
jgi:hypothetical protein